MRMERLESGRVRLTVDFDTWEEMERYAIRADEAQRRDK